MNYYINRAHVQRGIQGGFTQANHGKPWALRKMQKGDWIVFYSPKTSFENGEPLQAFTALGQVIDYEPYQAEMTPEFHPWRRKVQLQQNAKEAPIRPLINQLDLSKTKHSRAINAGSASSRSAKNIFRRSNKRCASYQSHLKIING